MKDSGVFAALANPTRRALLDLLHSGPQSVNELADHFDMRRPSVSEHLKVLREAGLVADERQGRRRIYRLEPAPLLEAAQWLSPYETFWRDRLRSLHGAMEMSEDE